MPDADPSTVRGTSQVTHILFNGTTVMQPEDLSRYVFKAYVPKGDGTFTVVDGSGTSSGAFQIPDVPPGTTYYLYVDYPDVPNQEPAYPRIYVTNKRDLDIGYVA